jgi:hypothetical protein
MTTTGTWAAETHRFIWHGGLATSTTYRIGFWAKRISGDNNLRYGAYSRNTPFTATLTNEWTFFGNVDSTTHSMYAAVEFGSTNGSLVVDIAGLQCEVKSHSTKYVNGSRSATDGWKDLSGNGNHADLTSLTYSTTNIVNTPNNDFSFDGANDYVSLGTPSSVDLPIGNNSRTVGVWFKANSGGSGQDGLIGWGSSGGTGYAWGLLINSNDTICIACYGDDVCAGSVRDDTWHYCVATHDSSTGNRVLYLDGVSIATDSSTLNTADASARVGDWIGSHKFHGTIDVVEVYNRALSSTEVLQNFNAKRSRFGV